MVRSRLDRNDLISVRSTLLQKLRREDEIFRIGRLISIDLKT